MAGIERCLTTIFCLLITFSTQVPVSANIVLTVNFINYTNPTGLCAECETGLEAVTDASQLTPVCCDESPFRSDNCDNTGEARCDTRFRWTIRSFGASLETRPFPTPDAVNPPYYFTNCGLSPTTCPFSEMSTTFSQGPTGFLGVAENPLSIRTTDPWTGSVQFFIEAMDSELPNIIDSLLVDLGNLRLGADFTEEMAFTGYHNISHMTMSFKVACQTGSCGRNCMTDRSANPRIHSCHPNGDVVCIGRYDPSTNCQSCLHNLDFLTDCSTCLEPNFDPDNSCSTCLKTNYDPVTNCTQCLPNREISTNCTQCSPGWDISSDCMSCLPGRDPYTDCTQCLPNTDISTNCTQCSPGWDISSYCMSCLPGRDPDTNCTKCLPNRDLGTDCSTCLFGFDINSDCLDCLPGRRISTNCTTCESGYTGNGESCVLEQVDVALVGGIAGGVGGFLVIMLAVIVGMSLCRIRRKGRVNFYHSDDVPTNIYSLGGGAGSSEVHKFENPEYGPTGALESKTETETSVDWQFTNSLYEATNGDHSQLGHTNPPTQQAKDGIPPHTDPPSYAEVNLSPFKRLNDSSQLHHATTGSHGQQTKDGDANGFQQPVYDEAHLSPSTASAPVERKASPSEPRASSAEGPTEDYSALIHPINTVTKPAGTISDINYSKLHGDMTEEPPTYNKTSHAPPQTHPHALPPHEAALYDTASYPNEHSRQNNYDYAETAEFTRLHF